MVEWSFPFLQSRAEQSRTNQSASPLVVRPLSLTLAIQFNSIQEIPGSSNQSINQALLLFLRVFRMAGSRNEDTRVYLSDLPDGILLHIISFLPIKSAAATSLLSRRWKCLWTSIPTLRLHEPYSESRSERLKVRNDFLTFAERVLLLHVGSPLVSFSFHLIPGAVVGDEHVSRVNTLITSAVRYNVEQLYLQGPFRLPFCLFESRSLVKLVELELQSCMISIGVHSMICLPRLKFLSLEEVLFENNQSAEKLLSHPLLEELILWNCRWDEVTSVSVNSPKLQSLSIKFDYELSEEQQICFLGDNLKFFWYFGFRPPTQYCICGSTMQLREAEIYVDNSDHKFQDMDGPSNRYCKLINSLSMVQNLSLSTEAAKSLYRLSQCPLLQTTFPVFEHVTRLNLNDMHEETIGVDTAWLTMLYKRCPHLEHLNFNEMIKLDYIRGDKPILRPMPSCFRTHLKMVTIRNYEPEDNDEDINDRDSDDDQAINILFKEDDDEDINDRDSDDDQAINLLFNSALVLEQLVIHWKRDGSDESKAAELERKLNARLKVSEHCRVSVILV